MATGRPTPYQAFGALYDRIKNIADDHGRQPYVAPMLSRRDTTLSLKILNLIRAVGKPSAHEIDKAKRAALKTVHPDLLMGSPELISDPAALEICLEEATHLRGYLEKATLALTPAADAAWEPTKNSVKYKLPPRRPPLERARSPTGGGGREPPPTPPTAAPQRAPPRATATSGAAPRPPGPPRAHSNHEATRQAAHDEASTRVRREQDARRHRQER